MATKVKEIYPQYKIDRRLLAHAPGRGMSRRGVAGGPNRWDAVDIRDGIDSGTRYMASIPVTIDIRSKGRSPIRQETYTVDISATGMLFEWDTKSLPELHEGEKLKLRFDIPEGLMPEGYESSVNVTAKVVRMFEIEGKLMIGVEFDQRITDLLGKQRWRWYRNFSIFIILMTLVFIFIMKMDSVFYFLFDIPLFFYGLCASAFLISRFFFAMFYRNMDPVPLPEEELEDEFDFKYNYAPGVTVIIPCFNEEEWITKTIRSCIDQYYPEENLEVIIVNDGSSDRSSERIIEFMEDARPYVGDRLKFIDLKKNVGKRHAMSEGAKIAKHDLLVFVDSDSFLTPYAVVNLVQPFVDPKIGAVSGRTEVENKWTNYITKMQAVRYYIAFRIFKAAEAIFDTVSCLSGPLACYRKELVYKHMDAWLNQKFFGMPATFGDDRSMTNFILNEYRTGYQDSAVCYTIVPSSTKVFLRQQMRWKRSWLRESLRAAKFMWRKEPFAAVSFYSGLMLPIVAPIITIRALLWLPLYHGIMPYTFIFGLFLMCMLISSAYLLLKRSRLWVYGGVFCAFYLFVLIWQMIPAIVTFWKAEWGTRETSADVAAKAKKGAKKAT